MGDVTPCIRGASEATPVRRCAAIGCAARDWRQVRKSKESVETFYRYNGGGRSGNALDIGESQRIPQEMVLDSQQKKSCEKQRESK
jgi:hypothetical protein